jgi:hypothetical protein
MFGFGSNDKKEVNGNEGQQKEKIVKVSAETSGFEKTLEKPKEETDTSNKPKEEETDTSNKPKEETNTSNKPKEEETNTSNKPNEETDKLFAETSNVKKIPQTPKEENPNITITNEYIDVNIPYNSGLELLKFYDDGYKRIINLQFTRKTSTSKESIVLSQTGGGSYDDVDKLTYPFKYFVSGVNILFGLNKTKPDTEKTADLTPTNILTPKYNTEKPYNHENDPFSNQTTTFINPVIVKEDQKKDLTKSTTDTFTKVSNYFTPTNTPLTPPAPETPTPKPPTPETPTPPETPASIIIRFTPNKITSLKTLITTRDPNTDIDITNDKLQYKELELIKTIKEKKQLTTDIYIEEVYYINGKLVVLKGVLNNTSLPKTPIDLTSNISVFENTKASFSTASTS